MDHNKFLLSFKDDLKRRVATDLEKSLELMFSVLNRQTDTRNELLALEGRFNQVKTETLKSIISYDTRTLQINKIRNDAIDLVEKLDYQDLNPAFSPELKTKIDEVNVLKFAAKKTEQTSMTPPSTPTPTDTVSEEALHVSAQVTPVVSTPSTSNPISAAEFEIFVAQHQGALKAFPRIYRRAREISIRKDANSANEFHTKIQTHIADLQQFETLMKPIRDNIKQIRLDRNNEVYWLQYKMLNDVPQSAEVDKLDAIATALPKLKSLHESLRSLKLI